MPALWSNPAQAVLYLILILFALGTVNIFSASFVTASREWNDSYFYLKRHLQAFGIGLVLLGGFCFSSLGLVVGMLVRQVDDISLVNSFFITPMTFFGGSFFPVQNLPAWLSLIAGWFPIGAINTLLRAAVWNGEAVGAALILAGLGGGFFAIGVYLYSHYSEY